MPPAPHGLAMFAILETFESGVHKGHVRMRAQHVAHALQHRRPHLIILVEEQHSTRPAFRAALDSSSRRAPDFPGCG
jgi:hypothetical protein